jgi:hypothetical protein
MARKFRQEEIFTTVAPDNAITISGDHQLATMVFLQKYYCLIISHNIM